MFYILKFKTILIFDNLYLIEGLVDGKLEPISRKKSIDFNDAEFLNLAKVIQNVSKKVCSESHQFTESKRPQSINRYGHIIDINVDF